MLKAEPLRGGSPYKSILQRYDNRHLHQPAQGMRQYPGRPSIFGPLGIKVLVMIFGKIVNPAFKEPNDSIGGMARHSSSARRTEVSSRFRRQFGPFLTLYHGQLNFLSILKSNFREWFKDPVLVEGFDGFCHG